MYMFWSAINAKVQLPYANGFINNCDFSLGAAALYERTSVVERAEADKLPPNTKNAWKKGFCNVLEGENGEIY